MVNNKKGNAYMRLDVDGEYPTIAIPVSDYTKYRISEIKSRLSFLKREIEILEKEHEKLYKEMWMLENEELKK